MKKHSKGRQLLTSRVFRLICFASLTVLTVTVAIIVEDTYRYFSNVQYSSLEDQTLLVVYGTEHYGLSYLEGINPKDHNVMWLDAEGNVLFDTTDDEIDKEEHAAFIKARKEGFGDGEKILPSLVEKNVYVAQRLTDGSVILVSEKQQTFFSPILGFIHRIVFIAAVAVLLSFLIAKWSTSRIVKPVNDVDLDDLSDVDIYVELMPLIERINAQKTEINQKENELKNRQAEFETVTDNMREGLVLLNNDGSIISINKAALRILGIKRSDAENAMLRTLGSFGPVLAAARIGKTTETVINMGDTDYQINESPVVSDNKTMGAVLFIFNITEREKSALMRREFTANVSHELKTPLQSISGYAELMMNGMAKSSDITAFSEKIYTEAKRITTLVDDILKLSKLDDNAVDMQRANIDLLEAAKSVMNTLRQTAAERGIELTASGESAEISAYPALLSAILHNLFENAVKYNRENGSVTAAVADSPEFAVLTVTDTGIGIPPEHIDRVFERFYRVDKSRSKEVGGTGLGLAIVKHAAKLHNASVSIESEPDKGTAVTVKFPKDPLP
ncbi:MAG: PAS domain-containing protein [Ruminiclostridium sp.]|nr:PAS domain-containing protein [Ruminiclostridium sp.]